MTISLDTNPSFQSSYLQLGKPLLFGLKITITSIIVHILQLLNIYTPQKHPPINMMVARCKIMIPTDNLWFQSEQVQLPKSKLYDQKELQ